MRKDKNMDSLKSNSCIAIDYSHAKLKTLKKALPDIPFDEFKTDYSQWQNSHK